MLARIATSLLGVWLCAGCAPRPATSAATAGPGRPPPPDDAAVRPVSEPWQWQTAHNVQDLQWSPPGLVRVVAQLESLGSAALMIVTRGQVVLVHGDVTTSFRVHSVRKSLLSVLFGIYVEEGEIDVSTSLAELGIDDHVGLTSTERGASVEDLLRARSGVYLPAASEIEAMRVERPSRGSHAPGTFWYYNNWDFNALGTIFEQETEQGIFDAFQQRIAIPIGMQDFSCAATSYGTAPESVHRSYRFRMSARDLARFGLMVLDRGRWQGEQVVPASWLEVATSVHSETGKSGTKSGYGYMWWVVPPNAPDARGIPPGTITASGNGGQRLVLLPSIETVVVHLMNTDLPGGPRIGTSEFDALLQTILAARHGTTID